MRDFGCNLHDLNVNFHFVIFSETWGTLGKVKLNVNILINNCTINYLNIQLHSNSVVWIDGCCY